MRQSDIREGMVLTLKPERATDYGMANPLVVVTGFKERKGYAVGWIRSGGAYFRPSDFARFVRWATESERSTIVESELTPVEAHNG